MSLLLFKLSVIFTVTVNSIFYAKASDVPSCEPKNQVNVIVVFNDSSTGSICKPASLPSFESEFESESLPTAATSATKTATSLPTAATKRPKRGNATERGAVKEKLKTEILQGLGLTAPPEPTGPPAHGIYNYFDIKSLIRPYFFKSGEYIPNYKYTVIFPVNVTWPSRYSSYPSTLISFKLNSKLDMKDVVSADLWFINANINETHNWYWLAVQYINKNGKFTEYPKIIIELAVWSEGGNWCKVSMKKLFKKWDPNRLLRVEISCKSCNAHMSVAELSHGLAPFILIKTNFSSIEASEPRDNRQKFYKVPDGCKWPVAIDFKTIGWNNWIISPEGFSTNYCKGTCSEDRERHFCTTPRITKKPVINRFPLRDPSSECCRPISSWTLELIYVESPYIIVFAGLPYIITEECGCRWFLFS